MLSTFSPLKVGLTPNAIFQSYPVKRITGAFALLEAPLSLIRLQGGLLNPWSIVGLKRDEVRVAQALAGLWMIEFGGVVSCRFLVHCLAACIEAVDWEAELAAGYRVATEISPLGLRSERIDLTIETTRRIVGIEMKIDAPLGSRQLERYIAGIANRARWQDATGHVVLLSPRASPLKEVPHLSWSRLAEAAISSVGVRRSRRSYAEQLIANFGDYVKKF